MITELGLATLMVLLTVAIHGLGIMGLMRVLRIELHAEYQHQVPSGSFRSMGFIMLLALGLFVLHGVEIWAYALLYMALDAIESLRMAVYFSTMTYATIGYSDEALHQDWRVLAAIEGINGVILMGWSTAFFVAINMQALRRRR